METITEIKAAIDAGKAVKCGSDAYDVIKDTLGQYLIVCNLNGYTVGLHGVEGTQYENVLNGKDFYIKLDPYEVDDFTRAYMECALWSSTDTINDETVNLDDNHSIEDISPETLAEMVEDCRKFQSENAELLAQAYKMQHSTRNGKIDYTAAQAGHDFWLTRCGHGAGFWDRGLGDIGAALTTKCGWRKQFDEIDLYIGDDDKIHSN